MLGLLQINLIKNNLTFINCKVITAKFKLNSVYMISIKL